MFPLWFWTMARAMASPSPKPVPVRLLSARYLITGQCYRPNMVQGQLCMGDWCGALRQCYHEEACGGFNYARTADSTSDVCLTRLLNELSSDEYRHAERVMSLLERSLTRRISC